MNEFRSVNFLLICAGLTSLSALAEVRHYDCRQTGQPTAHVKKIKLSGIIDTESYNFDLSAYTIGTPETTRNAGIRISGTARYENETMRFSETKAGETTSGVLVFDINSRSPSVFESPGFPNFDLKCILGNALPCTGRFYECVDEFNYRKCCKDQNH